MLKDLLNNQAKLKAEARDLLALADNEGRDLTEAEETRRTEIATELAALEPKIAKARELQEFRRTIEPGAAEAAATPALDMRTDEPNPARTGGFKGVAEFASAVRRASAPGGSVDRRLVTAPSNVHIGGGDGGEGYELPPQYREQIWTLAFEQSGLLDRVDVEPTEKREVKATADETTPWGAAGVSAAWRAEGTQMTASKLSTSPRSTPLHELYAFVLATEELLEDAPRLEARITTKSAQAIGWKIDQSIVEGNGVGRPLGWMKSDALVTVAKETSQVASTIVAQNVLKMRSRLLKVPGDKPFWMANSDTLPQLAAMTIGDQPAWLPNNAGLREEVDGRLLGFPLEFHEHAETLGTKGDLQLISPMGYYAARRTIGATFATSMHLYFDYNLQAFRWTFRFGGNPHLSAPVTPAKGSATKSHFVTLATRA